MAQARAVTGVLTWALKRGWRVGGVLRSPLRGPKGNLEWFVWLRTPGIAGMSGTRNVRCVGFYYHPRLQAAQDLAELAAERLRREVPHVWVSAPWDPERSEQHLAETDLLICIGGDGTVLRAARAASRYDVKILGVDMGRQAFLTEPDPRPAGLASAEAARGRVPG